MKTFITLAVFISYVEVSMAVQPDKKVPLSSGTSQIVLDTSTLDNPQVFVQQGAKPLFAGQIIGGRTTGSLGEDITPESIKAMTDCGEYEFGGLKCTPNDVVDPCRYCKTRVSKARGAFMRWKIKSVVEEIKCPDYTSFPLELQGLYYWKLLTSKAKGGIEDFRVCMVQEKPTSPPGVTPAPAPFIPGLPGIMPPAVMPPGQMPPVMLPGQMPPGFMPPGLGISASIKLSRFVATVLLSIPFLV